MISTDECTDFGGSYGIVFQAKRFGLYGLTDIKEQLSSFPSDNLIICSRQKQEEGKVSVNNMYTDILNTHFDFNGFKSYIFPLS